MRLLADENFPKSMVEMLRAEGNDVLWARTDGSGQNIVLTLDKDFSQLAVQRRVPLERSGVVLFRIHPATPQNLLPLVRAFVQADRKWAGQISILGTDGIQMLASRKRLEQ